MRQLQPKRNTLLKRVIFLSGATAVVTVILVACGGGESRQATGTAATTSSTSSPALATTTLKALAVPPGWAPRPPGYEVINGITVPPEPPPTLNNSTLAGVDVNKNGIRDDVERLLAKEFGANSTKYRELSAIAIAEQALILSTSTSTRDFYTNSIACATTPAEEINKLTYALLNTRSRSNAYAMALAGAIGRDCK